MYCYEEGQVAFAMRHKYPEILQKDGDFDQGHDDALENSGDVEPLSSGHQYAMF